MFKSGIIFAALSAFINLLPHRIDYRDAWGVIQQGGLALGGGFVVGALYGLCVEAMRIRQRQKREGD
jgi:hypothetical protein